MRALLIFGFPILEIWLLFRVGDSIGLVNTLFYLVACAVIGIGLMRSQLTFLASTQNLLSQQDPGKKVLHSILVFVAGLLFIFPGYISSVLALLLVLPGTRHLAAVVLKKQLARMMQNGSMHFASFGTGSQGFTWQSGGFRPSGRGGAGGADPFAPMRDVSPREIEGATGGEPEIIDVTPTKKDE